MIVEDFAQEAEIVTQDLRDLCKIDRKFVITAKKMDTLPETAPIVIFLLIQPAKKEKESLMIGEDLRDLGTVGIEMIIVGKMIVEIVGIEEIVEISEEKEAEALKNTEVEVVAEAMKKEENTEIEVLPTPATVDR